MGRSRADKRNVGNVSIPQIDFDDGRIELMPSLDGVRRCCLLTVLSARSPSRSSWYAADLIRDGNARQRVAGRGLGTLYPIACRRIAYHCFAQDDVVHKDALMGLRYRRIGQECERNVYVGATKQAAELVDSVQIQAFVNPPSR